MYFVSFHEGTTEGAKRLMEKNLPNVVGLVPFFEVELGGLHNTRWV